MIKSAEVIFTTFFHYNTLLQQRRHTHLCDEAYKTDAGKNGGASSSSQNKCPDESRCRTSLSHKKNSVREETGIYCERCSML